MIDIVVREACSPFDERGGESFDHFPLPSSTPFLQPICDDLTAYNTSIGCTATGSIERLRSGTPCVVTGQQLGFMGGPLYTILKGITALLLAEDLGAVPIFWLATEDHDVDEINHTYALNSRGDLSRFRLKFPNIFVEDLLLTEQHLQEIDRFQKETCFDFPLPRVGEKYATAMARLLAYLFRGTPMLFLEPYLLRPYAADFIVEELASAAHLEDLLVQQTSVLAENGKVTPIVPNGATHLFFKTAEGRKRILAEGGSFHIGERSFSKEEMGVLVHSAPENFSCGVAARPLLQSYLLPVQAYVVGPTEYNYYFQLKPLFAHHHLPMPPVVPRLTATLITAEAKEILKKCRLTPWDPLPLSWKESSFTDRELSDILLRERLKNEGIPYHSLHLLNQLIHPHGKWQERVLNWCYFEARRKDSLVQGLLPLLDWREQGHHYLYI